MDALERLRAHALSFAGAWEDHPWGESPVFKNAKGKIFLFAGLEEDGRTSATVKLPRADGEEALALPFVSVARYVGRYGWVTAHIESPFELEVALDWVGRSYHLVTATNARLRRA